MSEPGNEATHLRRLSRIQAQVARGEYQVDTQAVADAIVRRLLEDLAAGHERIQGN